MSNLFTLPKQVPVSAGNSLASARLYFFQAGSTTPQNVYTTAALNVAHDHPVAADANGVFPPIYLNPSAAYDYRVQLKTSADVLVYDVDNVPRIAANVFPRTAAEISAAVTPTNYIYPEGDIRRYGAVVDGSTDDTAAINRAISVAGTTGVVYFPKGTIRHTGITVSANITLRGEGMMATTLYNTTNTPSLSVVRTVASGSLLNCGLFGFTVEGVRTATAAQHGVIIDGCSTGYLVQQVRSLNHGGDGFRVRAGSIGPMFTNIVARRNVGFGINATSLDEDPGYNLFSSTSARFTQFVCSENDAGGVRLNGGDSQDNDYYYFELGLVESNGSTTAGTSGIKILNGNFGASFRDIWVEDNNDYGIHLTTDGNSGGQVPRYMMFENIYMADHDNYCIFVESGQDGTWRNVHVYGTGLEAYFTNLTAAGNHICYDNFPAFNSGGTGRSVRRVYGVIEENYLRIESGVNVDEIYVGDNAFTVARSLTTTNNVSSPMTYIPIAADTTVAFTALVSARRTDADNESAGYEVKGVVDRNATAGSTALVGSPTVTVLGEDNAAWDVTAEAETANGGFRLRVTGETSKTITWNARITVVKVTG